MWTMFKDRFLLSPDGEGGAGGESGAPDNAGNGDGDNGSNNSSGQTYERPKYFSQVAPAKADSDDYKQLYKYQKIDELADAAISLLRENSSLRDASKRSIVVPDGKDPEAVKEFAKKLGIPETADAYPMKNLQKAGLDDTSMRIIKENCHKAMLSERQSEAFGAIMIKLAKHNLEAMQSAIEERKKCLGETLKASYKEIPTDVDRASAAERDTKAYKAFAEESGLGDILEKSGMSYNTDFIKKIAAYSRKHAGQANMDTVPGGDPANGNENRNMYGKEFNDAYYGGKK